MKDKQKHQKKWRFIQIISLVFVQILSLFVFSAPAKAVGPSINFDPYAYIQRRELNVQDKVEGTVSESLLSAAMGSLLHGVSFFTRKLAYDTAQYVAYGGKGQGALAFKNGFGDYLEGVALDSAADAIGELGTPFGLNLCQIPDVRVNIFLQIGLRDLYANTTGPQPNCTWQNLRNGGIFDGDAWTQRYGTQEGLAETFSGTLSVSNNDFGVALGAISQINNIQAGAELAAREDRREGNGFKSLTSLISGDIKTPAQVVQEETKVLTAKHNAELSAGQIAGIYGSGLKQIPALAASVFLNTLTSQLLNRLLTEGLFPEDSSSSFGSNPFSFFSDGSASGNRARQAQNAFNFLFTYKPNPPSDYNPISSFSSCPDPENPGLTDCVIDGDFQQILARAQTDNPITIQEALDLNLLNENWPLISPRHRSHTDVRFCQQNAYCYSNLQKLRKVRILPLGFEIAALRSDPDRPWTLGEVVRGFESCDYNEETDDPTDIIPSSEYPFCRLINPNWIIALPAARCEAKFFGPKLASQSSALRRQECIDVKSCLQRDEEGNCLGYGYCTQEKNTWSIDADRCPAYANTCDTYTNQNGQVSSYLSRTLDFGQCTADDVGCRAYALEQINAEDWVTSPQISNAYRAVGRNQVVQFNANIQAQSNVCDPDSDGCSAFFPAARVGDGTYELDELGNYIQVAELDRLKHVQKAPAYLGCYDTNRAPNSPETNWPRTRQEAENLVSDNVLCENYAPACAPEEVGCSSYTPVTGGPSIPAKIGDNNLCSAECVGYETFKQLGYEEVGQGFESPEFPLYFIPANAQQNMQQQGLECNAAVVGCDEFTNLDSVANGGEGLEYFTDLKLCELPRADNSNQEVYYSWEGSAIEGFVLRTHNAKRIDEEYINFVNDALDGDAELLGYAINSPAYADETTDRLKDFAAICNEQSYNQKIENPGDPNNVAPEDCHALYDQNDQVYYRVVSELKLVSDQCHALRKTDTDTYEDNTIGEASCQGRGQWNGDSCTRCSTGGVYENGVCIYETVSEPGSAGSCLPAQNACRAYTGNAAGNTTQVASFEFEPLNEGEDALNIAREGWTGDDVRVVSEAPDLGLYSLFINGGDARVELTTSTATGLQSNAFYEVQFVARGDAQAIRVSLLQNGESLGVLTENQSIGGTWNQYRVGPVEVGQINFTQPVVLEIETNGQVFIDRLSMQRTRETLYLIKDSWKDANGNDVPLSCDINPNDGLPGAALGCAAYQEEETKGLVRYATGFEQLCRPEAVGCQPLWDTQNTVVGPDHQNARVFNLWCEGNATENCSLALGNGFDLGSCVVPQGEEGCYVRKDDTIEIVLPNEVNFAVLQAALPNSAINESTVYIPEDTAADDPIFLAVTEAVTCLEEQLGCGIVGLEEQTLPEDGQAVSYSHQNVRVKNNPSLYNEVLCSADRVGCSEYRDSAGASFYFKDPKVNGNRLCEYRESTNPGEPYGWFIADQSVGVCSNDEEQLCNSNDQCGGAGQCINQGRVSCYDDFVRAGGERGIWSNNSGDNYQGFVGSCSAEFNGCTELVDPADSSNEATTGKPYYVIENERFRSLTQECTEVSLAEGCVLFDKTDNPNKLYNSAQTYKNSIAATPRYGFVPPVTQATDNDPNTVDTNLILQVKRERECSEWLACRTSVPITIPETGEQRFACYQYQACDQIGENGANCGNWVDDVSTPEDQRRALNILGYDQYVTRGVSWFDEELSGYSLYNRYQITNMVYLGFSFPKPEDIGNVSFAEESQKTFIARQLEVESFGNPEQAAQVDCVDPTVADTDWQVCGFDAGGRCYNSRCLYPIDGTFQTIVPAIGEGELRDRGNAIKQLVAELDQNSCKGVPEQDAPFPFEVAQGINGSGNELWKGTSNRPPQGQGAEAHRVIGDKRAGFSNANVCIDGNCSCSYNKVFYRDGSVDYWPTNRNDVENKYIPASGSWGICSTAGVDNQGQSLEGTICRVDSDCYGELEEGDTPVGSCVRREKTETKIGVEGFCLEYDLSRPLGYGDPNYACLTWLPVETSVSRVDIYNTDQSAGYNLQLDSGDSGAGQVYCVNSPSVTQGSSEFEEADFADYNEFFDENDRMDVVYERTIARNCEEILLFGGGDYFELMCPNLVQGREEGDSLAGVSRAEKIAVLMQNWFWNSPINNSGKTAILLRAEGPRYYGSVSLEENDNLRYSPDSSKIAPFHLLAPADTPNDATGQVTYGIYQHPPRAFSAATFRQRIVNDEGRAILIDANSAANQSAIALESYSYPQPAKGLDELDERELFTTALAPGNRQLAQISSNDNSAEREQESLFRSDYEEYIRESDIDSVYFVPSLITHGLDGQHLPPLFATDIAIDFNALEELNPGERSIVIEPENELDRNGGVSRTSFCHKIDEFDTPNEEFPRLGNDDDCERLNGEGNNGIPVENSSGLWTYKLELGEDGTGIGINHMGIEEQLNIGLSEEDIDRNEIASRYVMVYYGTSAATRYGAGGARPRFKPRTGERFIDLSDPEENPFHEEACPIDGRDLGDQNRFFNWFAIGMDFNSDGEFLGYVSINCNLDSRSAAPQLSVIATLNQQCTEFVQVYQTPDEGILQGESNKAWTDRVWQGASPSAIVGSPVPRIASNLPFGSLKLESSSVQSVENSNDLESLTLLRNYAFANPNVHGIPLACDDRPMYPGYTPIFAGESPRCHAYVERQEQLGQDQIDRVALSQQSRDDARDFVESLFAKVYKTVEFDSSRGVNPVVNMFSSSVSRSAVDNAGTVPGLRVPQVYSLNPVTCQNEETCSAGEENNITVGGRNGVLTDYNGDGVPDEAGPGGQVRSIIQEGNYLAVANFFAFADDNRMPIRQVMVDWQDGSIPTNEGRPGLYKNRLPACSLSEVGGNQGVRYCADANNQLTGLTCDDNSPCPQGNTCVPLQDLRDGVYGQQYTRDRFGASGRACQQGYFEFIHEYSCSAQDVLAEPRKSYVRTVAELPNDRDRLVALGLADEDRVCVFKPRVQVRDNWGWCNGECASEYGRVGQSIVGIGPLDSDCYEEYQSGIATINQCSNYEQQGNNPWTEYRGNIIIIPTNSSNE